MRRIGNAILILLIGLTSWGVLYGIGLGDWWMASCMAGAAGFFVLVLVAGPEPVEADDEGEVVS